MHTNSYICAQNVFINASFGGDDGPMDPHRVPLIISWIYDTYMAQIGVDDLINFEPCQNTTLISIVR